MIIVAVVLVLIVTTIGVRVLWFGGRVCMGLVLKG